MEDIKTVSNPMTGEVEYVERVEGITKQDKVDSSNNSSVFHRECLQLVDRNVLQLHYKKRFGTPGLKSA